MNIIEELAHRITVCKQRGERPSFVHRYLRDVVYPRLASYAVFLDQINTLPNEHSLRGDAVTVEILEDYRQLADLAIKAEEYLT